MSPAEIARLVRLELFRSANAENLDEAMTLLRGQTTPAEWLTLATCFEQRGVYNFLAAAACRSMARGAIGDAVSILADVYGISSDEWLRYANSEHPS